MYVGASTTYRPYVKVYGPYSTGSVEIKGGDYPAWATGIAGSITLAGGDHSSLASVGQVGGGITLRGGLGYLSGKCVDLLIRH